MNTMGLGNMTGLGKQSNFCKICGVEFEPAEFEDIDRGYCYAETCVKAHAQAKILKNLPKNLIKAGIPPKYWDFKPINGMDIQKMLKHKGAYFWGVSGAGKTALACIIGREEILNAKDVKYVSSPKLIMELQNTYRRDSDDSSYIILDRLSNQEVLILDDIGAEKMTDFVGQAFYFLINEREQWERKTIITSNFSLAQLDKHIDSRVSSRIAGMCQIIELKGKDRRVK